MKAFHDFNPDQLINIINLMKEMRYFPARFNLYEIDELCKLYDEGNETIMEIGDPFVDDMLIPDQHPFDTLLKICEQPELMEKVLWYYWSDNRFTYMAGLEEALIGLIEVNSIKRVVYFDRTYSEYISHSKVQEINGVITNMEIHILYKLNMECAENTNIESVKQYCYGRANYWLEKLKTEGYKEHVLVEAHLCVGQ